MGAQEALLKESVMQGIVVFAVLLCAGFFLFRKLRGVVSGQSGCSCGCGQKKGCASCGCALGARIAGQGEEDGKVRCEK